MAGKSGGLRVGDCGGVARTYVGGEFARARIIDADTTGSLELALEWVDHFYGACFWGWTWVSSGGEVYGGEGRGGEIGYLRKHAMAYGESWCVHDDR